MYNFSGVGLLVCDEDIIFSDVICYEDIICKVLPILDVIF